LTLFRSAALAALVLLIPALAAAKGRPSSWTRYVNARFGYSIEYPAGTFKPERAPDNGDGRKFKATRGKARFMVWGGHNVLKQSPKGFVAETTSACAQGRARYALTGKGVAVVSCERKGEVLYAKRLFVKGRIVGFQMTYPVAERGRWDMDLARMAESLKAPRR
jgi:hypothetical protein